jgi:multidrug efflux pump subunit AcrA (membrane-fusion protein)
VPVPDNPKRLLRRTWVRRALPAGIATVLVVAGTAVTRANANGSPVDAYRTTGVTTGSVEQRLNLTGSVQRVNQVSQNFATAGTVTGVAASVGDTVTAGQSLASIDPLPLQRAVTAAQATLAKAKATLESDQSTTTPASGTGAASATTVTPAPTTTPTISPRVTTSSGRSGSSQSLAQAQQRVTSAQKAVTADLGQASAALTACVSFLPAEPPAPGASPTPATSTTSSATTAPTPTAPASTAAPSAAETKACLAAMATAPTQQQIQRDQQSVTRSQTDLMTSVTLAITTAGAAKASAPASPAAATGQSSASHASTGQSLPTQSSTNRSSTSQPSGGLSSGGSSTAGQMGGAGQSSASRVVSDQAAITTAQDSLASAQTSLTCATLKSSIPGTVGSVTLVKGASSGSNSIVIVGTGAVEVTVNVPLASMASVRVGQKANVTPQGATSSAPGSVTSISLLPSTASSTNTAGKATAQGAGSAQTSATSSSPVYPMVILVPDALPALASGSRADVSLLIGTAAMVLTVPNSALTPLGNGQAMAMTFNNGVVSRAIVKTGYAGTLITQVTSGLRAGQRVVLADLRTALPTNTINTRRLGVGGAATGGLGGAGLGGAGLSGAGLSGAGLGGGATAGGGAFPSRG